MAERKVALVAGGSGGVGEGIVSALMRSGYACYVPRREGDQSARLREYVAGLGDLQLVDADLGRADEVSAMRDRVVEAEGRIDAVVVSVGSYYYGYRMHRMPRTDFDKSIQDNLITHFNLQHAFIDQLRAQGDGVYVTLVGPESESVLPDEGVMSVMAAAQKMMTRVVAQEAFDSPVRVYAVTAHTSIKTRSRGSDVNDNWIAADELGSYVAALVAGRLPGGHEVLHELRNRDHVVALLERVSGSR